MNEIQNYVEDRVMSLIAIMSKKPIQVHVKDGLLIRPGKIHKVHCYANPGCATELIFHAE